MHPATSTRHRVRPHLRALAAPAVTAAALVVAGCGGSSTYGTGGSSGSSASSTTAASSSGAAAAPQLAVAAAQTSAGMVLVGASGDTVYTLLSAQGTPLPCEGACTSNWPPVLVSAGTVPTDGTGVSASLGTTARSDGSLQLTAGGRPLYYFVRDTAPGQVHGEGIHGFGGTWYAISADGQPDMPGGAAAATPTPVVGY